MNHQINSKNLPKAYDAGDMVDAYELAHEQMADTGVMLNAISNEFKSLKDYLSKAYGIPDSCFSDLKRIIAITNTMLQDSAELNQGLKQKHQAECRESQA